MLKDLIAAIAALVNERINKLTDELGTTKAALKACAAERDTTVKALQAERDTAVKALQDLKASLESFAASQM